MAELIVLVYRQGPRRVPCQFKGVSPMTIPREALRAVESAMSTLKVQGESTWWHYTVWEPVALAALGIPADNFEDYYRKRPAALAEFQRGLRDLYAIVAASLTDEERESIRAANERIGSANMDFLWDEILE